jgi:hypothetical protein
MHGDPAYPLRPQLQGPFKGAVITEQQQQWNKYMSQVIAVEWLWKVRLRLLHMMKTLILSFFTFLSIYIEGLEIFPFPQIFFENIKMQPRYNRKCYSLIFLPGESFNSD